MKRTESPPPPSPLCFSSDSTSNDEDEITLRPVFTSAGRPVAVLENMTIVILSGSEAFEKTKVKTPNLTEKEPLPLMTLLTYAKTLRFKTRCK